MGYFSIIPIDVFLDDRLSKTDLRVLGAIMSWMDKDTKRCHPSRKQISERCGLPLSKISTTTTRLVKLGWIEKSGNGGRSMRCNYKFKVPDLTVTESVTVSNLVTVTESVVKTVPEVVTKTVTDSGRGNKLKVNLNITESKTNIKENDLRELLHDISEQTFIDYVAHRKNKKSLITKTVVNGLRREANKAGITLEDALIESIERNWAGFKAGWGKNTSKGKEPINQNFAEKQYGEGGLL